MRKIKILTRAFIYTLIGMTLTSCIGDSYADPEDNGVSPFGNNDLQETNVITVAQLKNQFANVISAGSYAKIETPTQLKVMVTGNDISGNLYNQIAVQDETGAFIICIEQGGVNGYLPVGQEILVELKDLYVGGYGYMGEIGTPYTNQNGKTYVSRMSRFLWNSHFKILGKADASRAVPQEFDQSKVADATYLEENCSKLMIIKGITMEKGNGTDVWAPEGDNTSVDQAITGLKSSNIVVRTSTYADFANDKIPTGKINLTGIFTRYNKVWQIVIRDPHDIQKAE
ncbi:MAG: hypothetical protein J6Z41_03510 [Prevotella sp.]|nr:hypothetical protein [Prevotella sp.]